MSEIKAKNKKRGFSAGMIPLFLGTVILCLVVYLAVVLLQEEDEEENKTVPEQVTPLQAGNFTNASGLKNTFAGPLPCFPDLPFSGEARNVKYDGKPVRMAVLKYGDDLVIEAVRPKSGAPVLLRKNLTLTGRRDLHILGMPASMAKGEREYCLYFQNDDVFYAFYGRNMSEEDFLNEGKKLIFAN